MSVFARREHPLVLFLNDLQWLDPETLNFLNLLASDRAARHLLLLVAYRDNEVRSDDPLAQLLDAVRQSGMSVSELPLGPLSDDQMTRLLSDMLRTAGDTVRPLTDLVSTKTGGNPFFAIQFLGALVEEGVLAFDPQLRAWTWDLARIQAKSLTGNVVGLMIDKLGRLPPDEPDVLKQFACLGNRATFATLGIACGSALDCVHAALQEAVQVGLVLRSDEEYAFLHDRVQEAAYRLVPHDERSAVHLRIGRRLLAALPPAGHDELIFEIVSQFNLGLKLIHDADKRRQVAGLNLQAARRAKAAAAYGSAASYLRAGRQLLAENALEEHDRLAFEIEFHLAECEFLMGELAVSEQRLSNLAFWAQSQAE